MKLHAPGREATDTAFAADVVDSWKAIAQYIQKDVRTLQRWEATRNLPVHRMPGGDRPGVFALKSELDAWRRGRDIHAASEFDRPVAPDREPAIAILPFLNLAGDKENEYFADGLADEIIMALTRIPGLRVIARTSSFAFRGKDLDIRKIGTSLGASTILEGSVRRSQNRIRVTTQLINAADGCHLWGERYDRELTEAFTIQEEISQSILHALEIRLAGHIPPLRPQTKNPEAYQLWLMGRHHTQRQTPNQILRSRSCFEQAAALDPRFCQALVGIAESWWECASFGLESPKEAVAIGRYAVSRALELDPLFGDGVSMLGIYSGVHDFDWAASERYFKQALELDPASPDIHRRHAAYLLEPTNRLAEAHAELETALDLDPLSPVVLAYLGQCLMFERQFDEAVERLHESAEIDPGYWMAQFLLAGAAAFQGQFEKSLAIAEAALRAIGLNPIVLGAAGSMYGLLGQRARAQECLERLQAAGETRYVSPLAIAWIHLGLQDVESCLDWLEKAVAEREPQIIHFPVKPMYDGLRAHPRFQALIASMRLTPA